MKRRRSNIVPQRRRIFLGCEGDSERGYGALLRRLLEEQRCDVFLNVVLLKPGGGDPLALIQRAQRRLADSKRRGEPPYLHRAVLLDNDNLDPSSGRAQELRALANELQIHLIWQSPCHEAFLLRHIGGCHRLRPPSTSLALSQLQQRWPGYEKGLSALQLAQRIGAEEIRRASHVEPDLAEFLRQIGFG